MSRLVDMAFQNTGILLLFGAFWRQIGIIGKSHMATLMAQCASISTYTKNLNIGLDNISSELYGCIFKHVGM